MKNNIELLAPAGSIESFYAAVNSGADAVYLGGKNFNARQSSQNFDNDEMMDIIRYAHNKNVKVYVTLNTVLKDEEITEVLNYAAFLYENDVDAVIVQDLGLLYLIKKHIPSLDVNMSTQSNNYDQYAVKFYDRYKVSKVIMAREMTLGQLKEAVKNTNTDLEVFIHGALCTSYSGQCYMSSFLGGRSGNRGKCAQPCRLSYSFYDKDKKKVVDDLGVMPVLSMKDFKAGDSISDLINAGIKTFKIEGRMKGPEYTHAVVSYYRELIDNHLNNKDNIDKIKKLEKKADSTFSRGFTNGFLNPSPDDEMFARTSSGVKGDNISDIEEEIKDIAKEFSIRRRNIVDFDITLKVGEPATLIAKDNKNTVTIKSKELCEVSINNPATDEIIEEQLKKLGNTIYNLNNITINKDENVFIRKSTLNDIRRQAMEYLYEEAAIFYNREDIGEISKESIFDFNISKSRVSPKISLKINNNQEFDLIDKVKVKRVYIPYNLDINLVKNIEDVEKYLWMPNIVSKSQYALMNKNMKMYDEIFDGVCVNSPSSFHYFKQKSKLKIHCGSTFNIINSFAVLLLKEKGADGFTFSVEANIKDMESVLENTDLTSEVISYSYVQLMIMKNCPMSLLKNCKNIEDCEKCEYRNKFSLKDRKDMYFNIERENRLTHIYNSVPLTLIGKTNDFIRSGIEYYYIDTKWEENIEEIIDAIYCEINGVQTANVLREHNFTRGHYLKNIL